MSTRTLARVLVTYLTALVIAAGLLLHRVRLHPVDGPIVESVWKDGALLARHVRATSQPSEVGSPPPGVIVVEEHVIAEGPLSSLPWLLELGLVAGRDGVVAELDGRTVYATPDDLLSYQAYDHGTTLFDPSLGVGTHRAIVFHLLGQRLNAPAKEIERRAHLRRAHFTRSVVSGGARGPNERPPATRSEVPDGRRTTAATLDPDRVMEAVREAAHYLARNEDADGRFRYLVLAPTNVSVPSYNWPRHAGATFFLAQAAALLDDAELRYASLRAAAHLRDDAMVDCGDLRCIADSELADVGSSALAILAFTELVRTGADASYRHAALSLARFLRNMQRADGELMHLYQRDQKAPLDVQFLYFTGEAALALARAHAVGGDPRDLEAAKRALSYLVGPGWDFFGSRYYWTEEHWTCQATDELWERAPNEEALRFCIEWHRFQRRLQHDDGDSPYDADGSFGFGPFVSPRITPASSRGEAAGATLAILRRAKGLHAGEAALLDMQLSRAVAFVMRHQFTPELAPNHLFADAAAVRGALPGSAVDFAVRIDYVQHAGSAMIRWLELKGAGPPRSVPRSALE